MLVGFIFAAVLTGGDVDDDDDMGGGMMIPATYPASWVQMLIF